MKTIEKISKDIGKIEMKFDIAEIIKKSDIDEDNKHKLLIKIYEL